MARDPSTPKGPKTLSPAFGAQVPKEGENGLSGNAQAQGNLRKIKEDPDCCYVVPDPTNHRIYPVNHAKPSFATVGKSFVDLVQDP